MGRDLRCRLGRVQGGIRSARRHSVFPDRRGRQHRPDRGGAAGTLAENAWVLDGAIVRAKCGRAESWTITTQCGTEEPPNCPNTGATDIEFLRGLLARNVTFTGRRGIPGGLDQLRVFAEFDDETYECDTLGLGVQGRMTIGSPEPESVGPEVCVERFLALGGGILTISDGTQFTVGPCGQTAGPDLIAFGPNSGLWYGRWEYDGPYGEEFLTTFRALEATGERVPPLHFDAESSFRAQHPPASENSERLRLETAVDLDIAIEMSGVGAMATDLGGVDLKILQAHTYTGGNCGAPLPCEEYGEPNCLYGCFDPGAVFECPVRIEAIAPDVGNVWFTDLEGTRCVKYWNSLTLADGADAVVVDNHVNYTPTPGCPGNRPEAIYVFGDVSLFSAADVSILNLGGYRLYYGGILKDHEGIEFEEGSVPICGERFPLIKTEYGDFDGNCLINDADFELLGSPTGPPATPIAQTNPLFDFDGDCSFGETDYQQFMSRYVPHVDVPVTCSAAGEDCDPGAIRARWTPVQPLKRARTSAAHVTCSCGLVPCRETSRCEFPRTDVFGMPTMMAHYPPTRNFGKQASGMNSWSRGKMSCPIRSTRSRHRAQRVDLASPSS